MKCMADILDEAQSLVQCKTCPWYKNCVLPVRVTELDLRKQLGPNAAASGLPGMEDMGINQLLSGLASAAENSMLEGCPVFIDRLRTNPNLAIRLKKIMQEWSEGEENSKP
jgi:hypothetical protein